MDANAFAKEWIEGWNSHDLDRILSHYADNIVFRSPRIETVTGDKSGVVRGIADLRAYWSKALSLQTDLHFELDRVYVGKDAITIAYRNQRGQHVAETVVFDAHGMICEGVATYA
jgi:hypothetical protein